MSTDGTNEVYHLHAVVRPSRPGQNRNEFECNLSPAELERRFVVPYRRNSPIVIRGRTVHIADLERIRVYVTDRPLRVPTTNVDWETIPEATNDFFSLAPGMDSEVQPSPTLVQRPAATAREVFVVHGRNLAARDALFEFLRAIDIHPLEWSEAVQRTGKASPYIGDILDIAFRDAHAVVVFFTPDDEARLRAPLRRDSDPPHEVELTGQARPNVLFEAGMAMGRDPDHTILVELGQLRPFSDLAGRHVLRFDGSSQRRQELAQRLQTAGCPVSLTGTEWHSVGNFDAVLAVVKHSLPEQNEALDKDSDTSLDYTLSEEAKEFLLEASSGSQRLITRTRHATGTLLRIGSKSFGRSDDRRSQTRWEQALDELISEGLLEWQTKTGQTDIFVVTGKGFEVADKLSQAETK